MKICQFCFVFHKTYFSESSFRFTEKQGRSTEISLFSASHACIASPIINISPESGTSVIIAEPIIDTSQHFKDHSLHYGLLLVLYILCVWKIYNDMYIPYLYYTEYFHYPKYLVCFTCLSQSPPYPQLATTDLFTVSVVSYFSRMSHICVCVSCSVVFNSLQSYGLQPSILLYPLDFPGNSPRVGCHSFLQEIFLIQG